MKIEALYLKSFRSYQKAHILLHPHLTVFCGPNAVGKTNILEALGILSLGRSFRGSLEKDMARLGTKTYHIACKYKKKETEYKLSYGSSIENGKINRKIKLDEKLIQGRKNLIGEIVCVIFSPSDITILEGGPLQRRRFLDTTLSSQDKSYLQNLILFNQALRQRNMILKSTHNAKASEKLQEEEYESSLDTWDRSLCRHAAVLIKCRLQFIHRFKEIFRELIRKISSDRDRIEIELLLSDPREELDYLSLLKSNYGRDISLGYTSLGPHRHELLFKEGGENVMERFSQGQKRSLVIALRISQFYFLREMLQFDPILLIDDIFGDLDKGRRESIMKLLAECGQAVITTPKIDDLGLGLNGADSESQSYVYYIPSVGGEVSRM